MPITKNDDPFKGVGDQPGMEKVREFLQKARAHKESVDRMDPNFRIFEGCSFPAHCRDLKWNRNGTLVIPLEVAFRYISLADPMIYSAGVPLAVHIDRYSPTKILREEREREVQVANGSFVHEGEDLETRNSEWLH